MILPTNTVRRFQKVALLTILAVTGIFAVPTGASAQIKVGMSTPLDLNRNGSYVWLKTFADELRDNGMDCVFYPNSSIGKEVDRSEQVMLGLLEVNASGGQDANQISPLLKAAGLPFLFESFEQYDRLINETAFLSRVNADTLPRGIRVIDIAFWGGMIGIYNTRKPVRKPEDLTGLRIRAMERIQLQYIQSWGASGVQIAWEEVSQALETGIADGYVNPPLTAIVFGHTRQLKYFSNVNVVPSTRLIVFSEAWYQGLSTNERQIVDRAVLKAHSVNREWNRRAVKSNLDLLRNAGVAVIELTKYERQLFAARSKEVYEEIVPAGTVAEIMQLLDSVN